MAVKKLRPIIGAREKQFKNEANHLARVDHHNIVKLIGYCDETEERLVYDKYQKKNVVAEMQEKLLCYEYLPKGSLDGIIYDEPCGLEWQDRYKIIVGICRGLYYLHEGLDNTPIIHMDLKPSNILLDDRMEPKIADFGLSRLFGEEQSLTCTENLMGSIGYMAPEYWDRGEISTKSDIYSLGILILEIVTGKKNHQVMGNKSGEHFIEDVRKVWTHMSQKASKNPSLGADCLQQVHRCIEIGLCCVEADKERRPSSGQLLSLILCAGGCTHKVVEGPNLQGRRVVAAEEIRSSWSLGVTLKIAIGVLASALILLNLNRSRSWAVTALKFAMARATLIATGTVVVVLILYLMKNLSSSWRRAILFAIGIVLATALFLLDSSSPWSLVGMTMKFATAALGSLFSKGIVFVAIILYLQNLSSSWRRVVLFAITGALAAVLILLKSNSTWVVPTLKVVTALAFTFAIGIEFVILVLCLLGPTDLWRQRVVLFSTGVVLAADGLVLLNPSGSWSCVLMILKLFKTLMVLSAIGIVVAVLVLCLLNLSSSWQRVILFSIGSLLLAVVVVLWDASSAWSWVVITMKFATTLVTLFAIGMLVVYLILYLQNLSSSRRLVILLSIGPVLAVVLVLLNANIPSSWVAKMVLKLVAAVVLLFAIGIAVVYLVLYLLSLSGSWRRVVLLFVIGVLLSTSHALLNPTSAWSWVLMTMKVTTAAVILYPTGVLAAYLILHVLNVESFTLWVVYFFGMNYGLQFFSLCRDISRRCCGRGSPKSI
ncbi:hypothetical protein BS78_05G085100 [Paspalum vaginatum]|nr:hypothetical protein BS78_05G085100 [Paspalum vaginatum]